MNAKEVQANELRIGNWLEFFNLHPFNNTEIAQVETIDYDHLLADQLPDSYMINHRDLKNVRPIPLSKEVLIACGFEKENNGWHINKPTSYTQPYFSLFDKNYQQGELNLFLNGSDLPMPEIKYLHELQNCYYALTKTEIIYNNK